LDDGNMTENEEIAKLFLDLEEEEVVVEVEE
jgi:hypothetical protein